MSWISLTSADVKNRISGAEYTGVTSAALAAGQTAEGVMTEIIAAVVKLIRGYVGACRSNTLGDGETIPEELTDAAIAFIRARIFTRLPGLKALNDETRQRELADATRLLEQVAACKFVIEQPETASDAELGSPVIETIVSTPRQATRAKLGGL